MFRVRRILETYIPQNPRDVYHVATVIAIASTMPWSLLTKLTLAQPQPPRKEGGGWATRRREVPTGLPIFLPRIQLSRMFDAFVLTRHEDYVRWREPMRNRLGVCKLRWTLQEERCERPARMDYEPNKEFADRMERWRSGQAAACREISRWLGDIFELAVDDHKTAISMWREIESFCKPSGLESLSNYYTKLLNLEAEDFKKIGDFDTAFRETLGWIYLMSSTLELEDNFLSHLYLEGLKERFPAFVEQKRSMHDIYGGDLYRSYESLKRSGSFQALQDEFQCRTRNYTVQYEDQSPYQASQLVNEQQTNKVSRSLSGGPVPGTHFRIVDAQPGAIEGQEDTEWIVQLVKRCTICNKHRHCTSECSKRKQGRAAGSRKRKRQRRHYNGIDD